MKRIITHIELGGTLFIPAIHKNLAPIISKQKYPQLRSLVIDFEDGLDDEQLQNGYEKVVSTLEVCSDTSPFIFIRPRDVNHLQTLLEMEGIENIDGFVLPKFSLTNGTQYLHLLERTDFYIMPSIEGEELFNVEKLQQLKELILTHKHKILLVRFGLEDMLRQLSMRRSCDESVFDFAAGSAVIGNLIAIFKSAGLSISGGVYPCFQDDEGFKRDVLRDLKEGLFGKTIIHPAQIDILNELYKVTQEEYDEAQEILQSENVVFEQNGKMAEQKTMQHYSETIVQRAEVYGIKS
ncbi:HpcH/HpaI aldolase/citrate lyase family protein [Sulfurimonas sp. C5]|uniref:HpcH/HpaI aldolase/citrate lyase family protein n=1 Tax=Sulfurimonas sp. C5 TaxID=3036947 RepID=UPI00245435E2|nr:HpcH/HpaI aldolase/citrate lyase family protein [Sulfurimonas sp. C5]MDH4944281.1 HpcH/HpaI aldolase/citrate lyase family protein [Sulfurimonas sp. C5]